MTLEARGLRNPPRSKLRPSRNGKVGGKAVAQFDLLEVGSWESCPLRSFNTLSTSRKPSRFGRVAACCGVGSKSLAPHVPSHWQINPWQCFDCVSESFNGKGQFSVSRGINYSIKIKISFGNSIEMETPV